MSLLLQWDQRTDIWILTQLSNDFAQNQRPKEKSCTQHPPWAIRDIIQYEDIVDFSVHYEHTSVMNDNLVQRKMNHLVVSVAVQ